MEILANDRGFGSDVPMILAQFTPRRTQGLQIVHGMYHWLPLTISHGRAVNICHARSHSYFFHPQRKGSETGVESNSSYRNCLQI